MTQQVLVNVPVHDTFQVLGADGFTPVTGLLSTDFAISVLRDNNVMSPFTVTVTETAVLGTYGVLFTPTQIGFWEVQIASTTLAPNNRRYVGEYQVSTPVNGALPGQIFHDKVTDSYGNGLAYVTVEVFEANTANLLATTTTQYDGTYEITLTGDLAVPVLVDVRYSGGGIQTFIKQDVKLS